MQTESVARPLAPAATSGLGHRPELDGLRGISILLILYYHFKLSQQLPGGFLGVDIFFVLSGFLITSLLVEEWTGTGRISLRQFYARRALRLLPALGVLLGAMCAIAALFLSRQRAVDVYIASLLTLFYVTNWAAALQLVRSLGPLGITWSLAIEEQFYLLWPPLLAVMLRLGWTRRSILLVLTGLVLLVVGYRALLWGRGVNFGRLYYSSHTRADSLLLGCIAGLLVAWDLVGRGARMACWLKTLALVAVLLLVVLVNVIDSTAPFLYCGGFALVALAVAVLLLALTLAPPKLLLVPLRFAPLTWVGRISYALYLWHWPVHWYQYRLPGTRGRQALLGVALSFAL
ncbi:MAG TPA: acyltransferase, partial [Pyrinomonadaceae bacterium]|nr:acyltransferase [Pyrinomonadaceae bacterium]